MQNVKLMERSCDVDWYELRLKKGGWTVVYGGGPTLGIKFFSDDGKECLYVELPKDAADRMIECLVNADRNYPISK